MKLKTLKDLKDHWQSKSGNYHVGGVVSKEDLKQEAIAWIKEFREKITTHSHGDKSDPLYLKCLSCRNMFVQIEWIKHFFNIDKDLK